MSLSKARTPEYCKSVMNTVVFMGKRVLSMDRDELIQTIYHLGMRYDVPMRTVVHVRVKELRKQGEHCDE